MLNIRYHEWVLGAFVNERCKCAYFLDDLLVDVYSREVCDLFTKGSHHRNSSVILITQNTFHETNYYSDISLNAKCLVLWNNISDVHHFLHMAEQVHPKRSGSLYVTYLQSTAKPHAYLILDASQDTDYRLRYRNKIFPDYNLPSFYAPLFSETHMVELAFSASS